uniref:Apple domain-containing protein n=1 Tax=Populus alba TaxID=43335 RepID=A0A4U5P1N7_POPAL|nr:hypothetical protein D5086_0000238520 [Populus alba]
MNDNQPYCSSLPGTVFVNPNQRYNGCKRNYTEELCKVAEETSSYSITDMEKMTWDDFPYFKNSMSEEDCTKSCLQDCNCAGALYESGDCKKVKFPVKYAKRLEGDSSKVFFKFLFFSSLSQELLRPECGWEAEILAWPMSSL